MAGSRGVGNRSAWDDWLTCIHLHCTNSSLIRRGLSLNAHCIGKHNEWNYTVISVRTINTVNNLIKFPWQNFEILIFSTCQCCLNTAMKLDPKTPKSAKYEMRQGIECLPWLFTHLLNSAKKQNVIQFHKIPSSFDFADFKRENFQRNFRTPTQHRKRSSWQTMTQ